MAALLRGLFSEDTAGRFIYHPPGNIAFSPKDTHRRLSSRWSLFSLFTVLSLSLWVVEEVCCTTSASKQSFRDLLNCPVSNSRGWLYNHRVPDLTKSASKNYTFIQFWFIIQFYFILYGIFPSILLFFFQNFCSKPIRFSHKSRQKHKKVKKITILWFIDYFFLNYSNSETLSNPELTESVIVENSRNTINEADFWSRLWLLTDSQVKFWLYYYNPWLITHGLLQASLPNHLRQFHCSKLLSANKELF